MPNETLAIPMRYEIYRQDLSTPYLNLEYLGYVRDIASARNMCKAFKECDPSHVSGHVTYLFRCVLEKEEVNHGT